MADLYNPPASTGGGASSPLTLTGASDTQQLVVIGNATQTANLQEWRTSGGVVKHSVDPTGTLTVTNGGFSTVVGANGGVGAYMGGVGASYVNFASAGNIFLSNSSSAAVDGLVSLGRQDFRVKTIYATQGWFFAKNTGDIPLIAKAVASQTTNLTEWQNASGTALSAMNTAGNLGIGTNAPTASLDLPASTTTASSLRMRAGVAPTSPNEGDTWYDSTQKTQVQFMNGVKQAVERIILTGAGSSSIGNVTADTSIIPSSIVGTKTLPANFLVPGKNIRIKIKGVYTSTLTTSGATIKIKLGSTVVASATVTALGNSVTNGAFIGEVDITCYTNGATGTVVCAGGLQFTNGMTGQVFADLANAGATTTIDTTASQTIDVTAAFSSSVATQDIKSLTAVIEVLN